MSANFSTIPYRNVKINGTVISPYRSRLNVRGSRVSVGQDVANGAIDITSNSSSPRAQLHEAIDSTVGLWQFQESLSDQSGNDFHFTLTAGNTRYVELLPGLSALKVFTSNKYRHAATGTALAIPGDVTISMLISLDSYASGSILSYDSAGEAQANNILYGIDVPVDTVRWIHESGAGVDRVYSPDRIPALFTICHFSARRQSNIIQFFINGLPFGAASSALTQADGGGSSRLYLGYEASAAASYSIASLRIDAEAISDEDIALMYNHTLGHVYGDIVN